jgi:hypothetical protein
MNKLFPNWYFSLHYSLLLNMAACAEKAPLNDPSQLQINRLHLSFAAG